MNNEAYQNEQKVCNFDSYPMKFDIDMKRYQLIVVCKCRCHRKQRKQ